MDPNYNMHGAASQLEYIASERYTNPASGLQLSRCTKVSEWPLAYKVVQTGSFWRLGCATNDSTSAAAPGLVNEAVFLIQGIIWRHDLPPFKEQYIPPKCTKYLRQSVSLTGLGTPTFEAGLKGILDAYTLFSSYVGCTNLKACSVCDNCGEYSSLESSNRYFTPTKDAPLEKHIPFSPEIDPHGILSSLASHIYIQSENNVVEYFERSNLPAGKSRYTHISPIRFQVGDIVEAQISLMLVPLRDHHYQMVSVIRSLALLDNSFTQKAFVVQAASAVLPKPLAGVVVKRKVGYAEEELAQKRSRSNGMEIDDENQN